MNLNLEMFSKLFHILAGLVDSHQDIQCEAFLTGFEKGLHMVFTGVHGCSRVYLQTSSARAIRPGR